MIAFVRITILTLALISAAFASADQLKMRERIGNVVKYSGNITVTGRFERRTDDEMIGDVLCFFPEGKTTNLIPRGKNDKRIPWFCFENQTDAQTLLRVAGVPKKGSCGFSGRATVAVSSYVVDLTETETYDRAQLDRVVSTSKPGQIECDAQ
jgi:hypothetical protein